MRTYEYEVRFLTPAFLGDAFQNGRWRTPPFKALLRQWWRVAYAAEKKFVVDVQKMREEEGNLFGNAWLTGEGRGKGKAAYRRSLVRLRLNRWEDGRLRSWRGLEAKAVRHPEVDKAKGEIGPHLYLGYGPLKAEGGGTALKGKCAIQAGEEAVLSIGCVTNDPSLADFLEANLPLLERAMWLMGRYGAVGGRSRNGWGSFELKPKGEGTPINGAAPFRDRREALRLDWPHAIGKDARGPLIWQTDQEFDKWQEAMRALAQIKIAFRTQFSFGAGPGTGGPAARHWLAYPVTHHRAPGWEGQPRLPNSLRFKVRLDGKSGKLRGVIFHMPCVPPREFGPDMAAITSTWTKVHGLLDSPQMQLRRMRE